MLSANPAVRRIEDNLIREGMLPFQPGFLGTVAHCDPRLAAAIIRPDALGVGEPACGWGWEIITLAGQFSGTAADQHISYNLQNGIVSQDLWVRKVTYTVRRPSFATGSLWKAQSDYFNMLNPNIDFIMEVKSFCNYLISPTETPLETISNHFECVCPVGFVLGCNANISGQFINKRTLGDDETDTEAVIVMHCVRLPTPYRTCSIKHARELLKEIGLVSDAPMAALQGTPENADSEQE